MIEQMKIDEYDLNDRYGDRTRICCSFYLLLRWYQHAF